MAILGLGEELRFIRFMGHTKTALQEFLNSSPSISEAFGDNFIPLFEFEFSCFLTCVTDVAVYKQEALRNVLIPNLLRKCAECSYVSGYDANGLTASDIVNDRMDHYGAILRGDWEPPAYWNMSGTPIPQDAFTQQLALLGDYLHYSAVLGEVPVGDDIEAAPLGDDVINNIVAIPASMQHILFNIVLPHTTEYSDYFRRQFGEKPKPAVNGAVNQCASISQKKGASRVTLASCICAVILAISCAALSVAYFYSQEQITELESDLLAANGQIATHENTISLQKSELQELSKEKEEIQELFDITLNQLGSIGFIVPNSKHYHRFYCNVYNDANKYWAHNPEYCEGLGYSPCPDCWTN